MKKVLRLNLIMELPEGFQGGLREGLDAFMELREGDSPLLNPRDISVRVAWEAFAANERHGAKVICEDGIFELSSRGWRRLDKLPEGALIHKDTWVK